MIEAMNRRAVYIVMALAVTTLQSFAQQRIITAGSALTETVCALGDCDKIIASDRTSMYPESIQKLPSIGYRSSINAEGIISLKPTLIIAEKDYVEDAVLEQLQSSGIKTLIIDRQMNFTDTKKYITQIGTVLKRDAEAKKLITKIEGELAEAQTLLKKATTSPKVLPVYNRGASTMSVAGTNTFGDILPLVGATSAIGQVEGYKPLNTEALIAANPEYMLMLASGFESLGGLEGVLKIPGVSQTTAGKKKQIISMDGLKLTNFGPRLGEAVKELVISLHPELRAR
jgi:iron complex transport system substrate-binding protein